RIPGRTGGDRHRPRSIAEDVDTLLWLMTRLTVVVPCYNEAQRLDGPPLLAFLDQHPEARLIFVDDGSKDATLARIEALAAERPGRIETIALQPNRGKAEAVRAGMS